MRIVVAADIHGVTAALRSTIGRLAGDALLVSPWDADACPFANEHDAHAAFIAARGIESYARKIAAAAAADPAFIIAFSVGASATWLHAASGQGHPASVATLFYGSRIRDYLSLTPNFAITAIFAESEASCAPVRVARAIASDRVHASIEPGTGHGFMNPASANFSPALCAAHLQKLTLDLARFSASLGRPA